MENNIAIIKSERKIRVKKVQEYMQNNNVDACFLSSNVNFYYITGIIAQGYIYIPSKGEEKIFIQNNFYIEDDENVISINRYSQLQDELKTEIKNIKNIAVEQDDISASDYFRYIKLFQEISLSNATIIMREVRSIKTDFELELIRKDGELHSKIYDIIPSFYKLGMTDVELCADIEAYMRKQGHLGHLRSFGSKMEWFFGSLLVGDNAAYPSPYDFSLGGKGVHPSFPLSCNGEKIPNNVTLHIDLTGNYSGYLIDITRTYSIGNLPNIAYKLHDLSIEIHNKINDMVKGGLYCSEIYEKTMEIVKNNNAKEYFMGINKQAKFIGHGVGLQINELPVIAPRFDVALKKGMVIALEPKFVIEHVGAVGIENTYEITGNGMKNLTPANEKITGII